MDGDIKPFYFVKDDLREVEGILFEGKRILVPKNLGSKMVDYIYEGHMAIGGC